MKAKLFAIAEAREGWFILNTNWRDDVLIFILRYVLIGQNDDS